MAAAEFYLYADEGYIGGAGATLLTPYKVPDSYREANRCQAAIRANAERGFATLKSWKIFDRFRGYPRRVGTFAQAVLTLKHDPHKGTWKKLSVTSTSIKCFCPWIEFRRVGRAALHAG